MPVPSAVAARASSPADKVSTVVLASSTVPRRGKAASSVLRVPWRYLSHDAEPERSELAGAYGVEYRWPLGDTGLGAGQGGLDDGQRRADTERAGERASSPGVTRQLERFDAQRPPRQAVP